MSRRKHNVSTCLVLLLLKVKDKINSPQWICASTVNVLPCEQNRFFSNFRTQETQVFGNYRERKRIWRFACSSQENGFIQTKMRTLATKQQALLKPKTTETQCIYWWKEDEAMLKARNQLRQPRAVHACLEQFSRSIIALEYIWFVFYFLICLSSYSTKKVLQDKWGTELLFKWLTAGVAT